MFCEESIFLFLWNLIFLVLWPLMPRDSSWTTISRWTADLTAMFIDYFFEARVCVCVWQSKIYEQLFAMWINWARKLWAGIRLDHGSTEKSGGSLELIGVGGKVQLVLLLLAGSRTCCFFGKQSGKRSTVHCHSHSMAKNNCVYNREWDLENFLIIQRESMIQILAAG